MAMYGIDISVWNASLDLKSTGAEFVIVKATDGTRFVDDCCDRKVQEAKANGQLFGFYHFANDIAKSSMVAQADYFVDNCANYFRDGVPFLDWEDSEYGGPVLKYGPTEAKKFLDRVYERTGVRPLIYMSASRTREWDWSEVARDYSLWGAGYSDMARTYDAPGTSNYDWGAWTAGPAIHQYSDSDGIDKNIAYMTRDAWAKFAAGSGDAKATEQQTGWIKQDGRWWYRHADGSYTQDGWEHIDGKWYLFDATGWMLTGWQQVSGKWYFLTDSGAMATGWVNDGGKWYYMDPDSGAMHEADVLSIGGKWYAFSSSGEMQYGVGSDASGALKV